MKQRLSRASALAFSLVLFFSCTKINESTELGRDLIPAVDNVTTFDTTLEVQAFNEPFTDALDSVKAAREELFLLGQINNDPVFGKTTASVFFEVKPTEFPFRFPFKKDSAAVIDSVVLVLGYALTYGDTNQVQRVNVHEITSAFRYDTSYLVRKDPGITYAATPLGSKTYYPRDLNDSVKGFKEAAANQLRIPLSAAFGQRLLDYSADSNFLKTEVGYRNLFKGFALVPQNSAQANALIGLSLRDTNTKLSIYYRQKAGKNNGVDSTERNVVNLRFAYTTRTSARANYIQRDYNGSQLQTYLGGTTPDDLVFIQNTPGTYANIIIPGLRSLGNRIVHRAELIAEQVVDPLSDIFPPPPALYLDLFDSASAKYRALPFDVELQPTGQGYDGLTQLQITNPLSFGLYGKKEGNRYTYKFNISRYVQRVLNQTENFSTLRLSATSHGVGLASPAKIPAAVLVNGVNGIGRVRLGGGNHPTQRMRLRIIYSRI